MKNKAATLENMGEFTFFHAHPEAWGKVLPHVRALLCGKDEMVLHHGDAAATLWLVLSGWVKLTRQTPDGKETIIGLCTTGDVFGEAALFPHASYPYHAESIAAGTELVGIPSDVIRRMLAEDPSLSSSIMSLLNERVSQTQLQLEHLSTMSSAQRLGCFLLRLCNHGVGQRQLLHIPVEKHLLAAYLGMKPETLSRSQQQLKTVGVDVKGAEVTVSNVSQLRDFVCESCSESGNCESEMP